MAEAGLYIPEGYSPIANIYKDEGHEIIKAKNIVTDNLVILKISRPGNNDILKISKLSHEYNTLKRLNHEGIIKVHALLSKSKSVCVVEEFFEGETLKARIFRQPFSLREFFQVALQLADILAYVHSLGIIHKDINTTNILISGDLKVKLIDFGISTNFTNEEHEVLNPANLEGTLTYISPEQTGRTSYSITPGSDLYSLGIVFYEMISGKPPFDSADALEVIHFHLSRIPASISKILPGLPAGISLIISELLEKIPDDRYQSANGLLYDLRLLEKEIAEGKATNNFRARTHDKSGKFRKTQRLYGRENEINNLLNCYNLLSHTGSMLALVAGYSGVGKSAVVKQLQRPVTEKNGLFISGKFDQFKRNIPYFAFIEAFDTVLKNILMESDVKINEWKDKFMSVLGNNAVLITEVIPSLEFIVGNLPQSEKLAPAEQEYRFRLVLLDFIYCFTSKTHPLVIFLDDLQWSDLPSLNLIERILTYKREDDILIVGAYRSNEVSETHPLLLTLQQLQKENTKITIIDLQPLNESTTIEIVADSFGMSKEKAAELGKHVFFKTQGNPFFINRFLQSLYENKLVYLTGANTWTWNQEELDKLGYTDNVIDLMAKELTLLPPTSRETLKFAALLGNSFNIVTMSKVMQTSPNKVFQTMQPALNTGYLLTIDNKYRAFSLFDEGLNDSFEHESDKLDVNFRFLHDRVQQAAYALIDDKERSWMHLKAARILLQSTPPNKLNDLLFDIASHFSHAHESITELNEKITIADLYQKAGAKAKDSTSYDVAIKYLDAAKSLLPADSWKTNYKLTFDIYAALSECESLNGQHEKAEKLFDQVLKNAQTKLEKLKVYYTHSALYLKIGNTSKSLQLGRDAMKLYDISFPEGKNWIKLTATWEILKHLFLFSTKYKNKEKLYHLPECTDPEIIAINQFLIDVSTSAYQEDQNLMVVVVLRIIQQYLKHGYTDAVGWGFSGFSVVTYSGIGLSKLGFDLWDITLALHKRIKSSVVKTKQEYTLNAFFNGWKYPLIKNLPEINNNVKSCLMNGDLNFAGYAIALHFWKQIAGGVNLNSALESVEDSLKYLISNKIDAGYNFLVPSLQLAKTLNNPAGNPGDWEFGDFDEDTFLNALKSIGNSTNHAFYYNFKLPYYYFFDRHDEGIEWANNGDAIQSFILGHYFTSEWYFYYSLMISSKYESFNSTELRKYNKILARNLKWFTHWVKGNRENFEQQLLILEAEKQAMAGDMQEAILLYEKAIAAANKNGFTQYAAIANERAAKLLAKKGINKQSNFYLKDAFELYDAWGAYGKCKHMKYQWPEFFSDKYINRTGSTRTNLSIAALDYNSLIKASHSISSKIKLDELINRLMNVLLENAGAQKGVLIIPRNNELYIVAEGIAGPENIQNNNTELAVKSNKIPQSLINYCWRTLDLKASNNALRDDVYSHDPYVKENQVKSMVCIPLTNKGNKVGLIYLENKLIEGVFTPNKMEVLNMLSGQIGISIDNALLYENLEAKVKERTIDLEEQKHIAESRTIEAIQQKQLADEERKKTDTLLLNILPSEIADELKSSGESKARLFESVTVLFSDFVNFTTICEQLSPSELVFELNKCFAAFDKIMERNELEKIKTIGDAYLAVCGLPTVCDDHAIKACRAAKDILQWINNPENECKFEVRIGLNSGPVIAGIVGLKKYVYDIWGDTVNTASRLESSSIPGKINISETTYQQIKHKFPCEYRGEIEAKNKGYINMYFLE